MIVIIAVVVIALVLVVAWWYLRAAGWVAKGLFIRLPAAILRDRKRQRSIRNQETRWAEKRAAREARGDVFIGGVGDLKRHPRR